MTGGPRWDRRRLLRTGAAAFGGAGVGWTASAAVAASSDTSSSSEVENITASPPPGSEIVPFRGVRQPGVATPPQAHLSLIGFDLRPGTSRADLTRLMRLLSDDADRLSSGVGALADTEPELAEQPSRLTVTFGFGPSVVRDLVPEATGLRLDPLPRFETDRLEDEWSQTDLAIQICCDDAVSLAHARRMILKDAASFGTVRWTQQGFRRARGSEPDGTTMRNLMGQLDGTVNPAEADPGFAELVWRSSPEAMAGGTFMVVRRIRMHLQKWDRVDRIGREAVIGRRIDSGAPLTGDHELDEPDFKATDRFGFPVIDPASHIRRARSDDPRERFLRRGYNYTVPDTNRTDGEDSGLVFIAYAADLGTQFVPVQRRLAELDRLNEWVTTIGSAVYALPPGATAAGYVGESLLEDSSVDASGTE